MYQQAAVSVSLCCTVIGSVAKHLFAVAVLRTTEHVFVHYISEPAFESLLSRFLF